jgi:hypothetical protein
MAIQIHLTECDLDKKVQNHWILMYVHMASSDTIWIKVEKATRFPFTQDTVIR